MMIKHRGFKIQINNLCKNIFILFWIRYTIINWICIILNRIPGFEIIKPFVFPSILCIMLLFSVLNIIQQIKFSDILLFIVAAFLWEYFTIKYTEYKIYFSAYGLQCLTAFMMLYVGKYAVTSAGNSELFILRIKKVSVIGIMITASYFMYCLLLGRQLESENMFIAYTILPSILVVIAEAFQNITIKNTCIAIFSVLFELTMGTRGPIVILLIFIIPLILTKLDTLLKKIFFSISCFGLVIINSIFDFGNIMGIGLLNLAESLHLSTRVIDAFISNGILDMNGRDVIQTKIVGALEKNPQGLGIFADRYLTTNIWGTTTDGTYVHNLLYELWIDFGYLIGTVLFIGLCWMIIRVFIAPNIDYDYKILAWSLICACIFKLFFSSSWLIDSSFYLCVGYLWGLLVKYECKMQIFSKQKL